MYCGKKCPLFEDEDDMVKGEDHDIYDSNASE